MKNSSLFVVAFFVSIFAQAQNYSPAVDYSSLMNLKFYEQSGGFMIEAIPVLFPPDEDSKMEFEITSAEGKT